MKVLFLTRRFYPDIGGVEKHVLEIGKRLVRSGHNIVVVTQSQGKEKELEGIRIVRITEVPNNTSEKTHIWKWLFTNRNLIEEADIVHAHDVYFWYFPFRFLYPFKKSFITFHGYESYPIKKKAIVVRKLSEYLANGNIIVGDFIKKWYGTNPNYVTYGGVEISNLPARLASKRAGKAGIKYQISNKIKSESAVFIGRLDEQTGILDYAEAIKLIKKKISQFEFAIIGDGKYKNRLKEFKVMGFDKNAEKYFKKYNFAFVSRYLSILEAMANRRLVFAHYDNPVKEDYLKRSPFAEFIIIENSAEKIAEKVNYYFNHQKEASLLINKAYEWVKNESWTKVVKSYTELWGFIK